MSNNRVDETNESTSTESHSGTLYGRQKRIGMSFPAGRPADFSSLGEMSEGSEGSLGTTINPSNPNQKVVAIRALPKVPDHTPTVPQPLSQPSYQAHQTPIQTSDGFMLIGTDAPTSNGPPSYPPSQQPSMLLPDASYLQHQSHQQPTNNTHHSQSHSNSPQQPALHSKSSQKGPQESQEEKDLREYNETLHEAYTTNFDDLEARKIIYVSGTDFSGSPVVAIIAGHIPSDVVHTRLFLYFIKILHPIVVADYVIVYVHTGFSLDNTPSFGFLKRCYGTFQRSYRKNIKKMFVIEAPFWIKTLSSCFKPFISAKFWKKLHYVENVSEVYKFMGQNQFQIPDDVKKPQTALQKSIESKKVFGVDLEVLMKNPLNDCHPIPVIVTSAINEVLRKGIVEGVFRLSGSRQSIQEIQDRFNKGENVDFSKVNDIHVVTGVLKSFFRELPNPLCTYDLYYSFLGSCDRDNVPQSVQKLKANFLQLPKTNQLTLLSLMDMLHRITEHQDKTMMTAVNLAIVWAPNILKNKNETPVTVFTETGPANLVVSMMITHFDDIFLRTATFNPSPANNTNTANQNANPTPIPTTTTITSSNNNVSYDATDPSQIVMNIPLQHVTTNMRPRSDRRVASPRGHVGPEEQHHLAVTQPVQPQNQELPLQSIPQLPLAANGLPPNLTASQEKRIAANVTSGSSNPKSPRQQALITSEKRMNRRAFVVSEVDIEGLLDGELSEDDI